MSRIMKRILIILTLVLTACAPRGESKSLDEVYELAVERFNLASNITIPNELESKLEKLTFNIDKIGSTNSNKVLAENLNDLINRSSYTVRPGLTELTQILANSSSLDKNAVKLLQARILNSLASELETGKFRNQ